ncbi:MAG: radical SAM protein, partial [Coriobacteriia bacterium]|nr:radical SAM protein [Coriobacteriia bacterium]
MLRDYVFHDATRSFCPACHELCDAKVIIKNGSAYLLKTCLEHGQEMALFEEDASYLLEKHRYDKPGNRLKPDTRVEKGCPYDCGLCPDHEQHTCIGLIEITHACDLNCPVCYASSGEGAPLAL